MLKQMIAEKIKSLNRSHFSTIFKGNLVAKFVLVIGGLMLAKYYGPEQYGSYSIYLSIVGICTLTFGFGMEHLIVLSTKKGDIINSLNSINLIAFLLLVFSIIFFFNFPFEEDLNKTIILGLISGFFLLVINNIKYYLAKKESFKNISLFTITEASLCFLFQIIFIFLEVKDGLILGNFIGFAIVFLIILFWIRNDLQFPDFKKFSSSLKKRKDLIIYSYPSNIINSLGNNIMPILISFYFAYSLLGEFSLASKILSVPMLLISSSLATVFYPKAVSLKETKGIHELKLYTKKISRMNFLIILSLFIVLNTFGIYFIEIFYDKGWENIREFMFILSLGLLGRSLVNPVADILTILKKNYIALIFNIYLLIANLVSLYIGIDSGIRSLIYSYSFSIFIGYLVLYLYIMQLNIKNEHY